MILQRIEITLGGPDDYPEDESSLAIFLQEERKVKYLFREQLRIAIREIIKALPDEYEIEADSIHSLR